MTLDFWFDYSCPYAYLASTQVDALADRTGAWLAYRPMLLGGVFKASGTAQNLAATLGAAKAQHNARDMARFAELFGVPLRMPAGHPLRTVEALRATIVTDAAPAVVHGFFRAYWVDGEAPSERATMERVLGSAGFDSSSVLARIEEESVKDDLRRRTDDAIARGVFGAPSFIVNGEQLFWGQDRLHFVERAVRNASRASYESAPRIET